MVLNKCATDLLEMGISAPVVADFKDILNNSALTYVDIGLQAFYLVGFEPVDGFVKPMPI